MFISPFISLNFLFYLAGQWNLTGLHHVSDSEYFVSFSNPQVLAQCCWLWLANTREVLLKEKQTYYFRRWQVNPCLPHDTFSPVYLYTKYSVHLHIKTRQKLTIRFGPMYIDTRISNLCVFTELATPNLNAFPTHRYFIMVQFPS